MGKSKLVRAIVALFSCGHATLHLAVSVGRSVCTSLRIIFESQAVFPLLPLPIRPRLDCRVSGLVYDWLDIFLVAGYATTAY